MEGLLRHGEDPGSFVPANEPVKGALEGARVLRHFLGCALGHLGQLTAC